MSASKYLVAVQCMTYNQSQYILDALNGITMQETTFPFVVLVVDDASTDGEQDIIRRYVTEQCETRNTKIAYEKETDYAHIAYAQHSTNRNCYIATIYLKENHYGQRKSKTPYIAEWRDHVKYIAVCEGDDYWIDPQKLQRQVDFMETHPDYSASTENGLIHFTKDNTTANFSDEQSRNITFEELLIQRRFPTASVIYRASFIEGIQKLHPPVFDTLIWAYLSKHGHIHYNSTISSVYRRGCGITESDRIRWAYTVYGFNKSVYSNFDVPLYIQKIRNNDVIENIDIAIREARKKKQYINIIKLTCIGIRINPKHYLRKIKQLI